MARIGSFDVTGRPTTWFDETAISDGWFDPDLIGLPAAAGTPPPNRPAIFADGNQGVLSLGAAIGAAALFASAVFMPSQAQPTPQTPYYDAGSQLSAVGAGQAFVTSSPALFQTAAVAAPPFEFIQAGPQADPTPSFSAVWGQVPWSYPALRQALQGAPQADPSQIAASIFHQRPAQSPPVRPAVIGGPQSDQWQIAASVFTPIPSSTAVAVPALGPIISASPQSDPTQIQGSMFVAPPASTAPQTPTITALTASPQSDPSQTAAVVFGPRPSQAPGLTPIISAAPQADPSQIAAQVYGPRPPTAPQPWGLSIFASPQSDPSQIAAQMYQAPPPTAVVQAPPLAGIITGQRVEYFEGTQAVWSPSFAPSVAPTPVKKHGGMSEWPLYVWRLKQSEDDLMLLLATALKSGMFD